MAEFNKKEMSSGKNRPVKMQTQGKDAEKGAQDVSPSALIRNGQEGHTGKGRPSQRADPGNKALGSSSRRGQNQALVKDRSLSSGEGPPE